MRRTQALTILTLFAGLAAAAPSLASAQDDAGAVVPEPPSTQLEAPMAQNERVDGPRFRGGVALTAGGEFFSDYEYSAMLFGIDGRLGVQINDLIGVYFAPHLSAGGKRGSGYGGATATLGALVMADFTLMDALFAGAGAGWMVFNNPNGPAIAFRVGGYPLKGFAKAGPRRRGLVVSLETRIGFLGDDGIGTQVMGALGYEAF